MSCWAKSLRALAVFWLLGAAFEPCHAQAPQPMVATRPFAQAKLTDAAGKVSYRVGTVFAEPGDETKRLSVTFICEAGRTLSLYIVQTRVPPDQTKAAKASFQVDDAAAQQAEAKREVANGLSAYTVANTAEVETLAKAMGAGKRLRLTLDDRVYEVTLEGLGAALSDLEKACPRG